MKSIVLSTAAPDATVSRFVCEPWSQVWKAWHSACVCTVPAGQAAVAIVSLSTRSAPAHPVKSGGLGGGVAGGGEGGGGAGGGGEGGGGLGSGGAGGGCGGVKSPSESSRRQKSMSSVLTALLAHDWVHVSSRRHVVLSPCTGAAWFGPWKAVVEHELTHATVGPVVVQPPPVLYWSWTS